MVIYQYSCCCKASYIGLTTRHLRKRIKEHVPKSVENFCFSDKKDDIPVKAINAFKRSSIAEHLVNNSTCANSYSLNQGSAGSWCSRANFQVSKIFAGRSFSFSDTNKKLLFLFSLLFLMTFS